MHKKSIFWLVGQCCSFTCQNKPGSNCICKHFLMVCFSFLSAGQVVKYNEWLMFLQQLQKQLHFSHLSQCHNEAERISKNCETQAGFCITDELLLSIFMLHIPSITVWFKTSLSLLFFNGSLY